MPSLTSQPLRSRCRSLTWLLYASPCSMALEKSPEPPISMGNAGSAPHSPIQHPCKAPDSIHPKSAPLAGSHPHPTPDGIWRQLGTRHGDVPERTGLAEELLDVRRDGFHLPGREGHKMASPHHPQPPACSPLRSGAHRCEYVFLERSRWTRLAQHPRTSAPKSCEVWGGETPLKQGTRPQNGPERAGC